MVAVFPLGLWRPVDGRAARLAGLAGLAGRSAAQPGRGAGKFQAGRVTLASAEPDRRATSSPEAWRRPPQPEYLVFAGSQSRLVQLILAQTVGLGHLRGRLFET